MPYDTIEDLPPKVRTVLTRPAQEIFLAAFNDAFKRTQGDEKYAFSVAWSAVGRNYERQEDGSIEAITEKRPFFSNKEHLLNGKHAVILQTLDRKIGGTEFKADAFASTLDAWAAVPLIYVPKGMGHPDLDAYDKDYEAALAKVKGRVVKGGMKDVTITTAGHPRLVATGDIKDKEIDDLIKAGAISLSTAFRAPVRDGGLAGAVEPHHILLFEEDASNMPKDEGSGFLNKEEIMTTEQKAKIEEGLTLLDKFKAWMSQMATSEGKENTDMAENKELEAQLTLANKALEDEKKASGILNAKIAELTKENEMNKAEVQKKADALKAFEQKQKDEDWEAVKNKLPKGFVHKDKEAESRRMFEENPRALMEMALDFKMKAPTGKEGDEQSNGEAKAASVGRYDPYTQKYVPLDE
jgi:cation transport regulator